MTDVRANMAPPAAPLPQAPRRETKAEATAREFEAVFLGQMAKLMMESVELGDEFSGGHGEEMFRGVLAETLGAEMAKGGGVGLAPAVLDQIIRMQGGNANGQ
jgi:Rod binding domain-containing protein